MVFRHQQQRSMAMVSTAAAIILVGSSAVWLYQTVASYGWEGTLRYIWEGDPYSGKVRKYLDTLQRVKDSLDKENTMLSILEEGLERAKLDSIDAANCNSVRRQWEANLPGILDLQLQLAKLSHDLDKRAAEIDQVPGEDVADIRSQKKSLSRRVVLLMERTDILIRFFERSKVIEQGDEKANELP